MNLVYDMQKAICKESMPMVLKCFNIYFSFSERSYIFSPLSYLPAINRVFSLDISVLHSVTQIVFRFISARSFFNVCYSHERYWGKKQFILNNQVVFFFGSPSIRCIDRTICVYCLNNVRGELLNTVH